jgi:hypothetical protein
MRDPYNPIEEDIRAWASNSDSIEPEQDWDLMLANIDRTDLYLELASDDGCPNADYFLSVLYLIVGDAVRTEFKTKNREEIEDLLNKAKKTYSKNCIHLWIQRSIELIKQPESFDYDDWCAGGLVQQHEKSAYQGAAHNERKRSS